jgi:hypothetical protein
MSQDPALIRAYVDAVEALDRASTSGDLAAFDACEVKFADAAEAYADDLDRCGFTVPHGLREQIERIRGLCGGK